MKTVDISIDYDFFCYMDADWEFGSHEAEDGNPTGQYLNKIVYWQHRYGLHDLFEECDPLKRVGFLPGRLPELLLEKKGLLVPPASTARRYGIADSHVHAYHFFAKDDPADFVVNFDAHHDFYSENKLTGANVHLAPDGPLTPMPFLNCGNWATALYDRWASTQFLQVYPDWKKPDSEVEPRRATQRTTWSEWAGLRGVQVRNVFLCRSPEWSPPHLDSLFLDLTHQLTWHWELGEPEFLDTMPIRPEISRETAAQMRAEIDAQWQKAKQSFSNTLTAHEFEDTASTLGFKL